MKSVPLKTLAQKKISQLYLAVSDPPMYISVEGFHYDENIKAIVYQLEIGILNSPAQTVTLHHVNVRYSVLCKFDREIRKQFCKYKYLLPFPPKKICGNLDPKFVEKRAEALQNYLGDLTRIPGICKNSSFLNCFSLQSYEFD